MPVADFLSTFFSWGDASIQLGRRLDAIFNTLFDIQRKQEKMALDFTKLTDEVSRVVGIKDRLVAELEELKKGLTSAEDQAKVDEIAATLNAELSGLESVVTNIAPDAPAPAPVEEAPADAPPADAPVDAPTE